MRIQTFNKASLLAGLFAVAGCVSVLPEPATPDALYRIEAQTNGPALLVNLIVREPEAPRVFAGAALVSEDASGALRLVPGAEWAGPATRQLQLAIVDSFTASDDASAVLPEAGVAAPFELISRIKTFGFVRGEAVCELSLNVINARTRNSIASTSVEARAMTQSQNAQARASVMKRVAEACTAKVAAFAASVE